MKMSSSLYLTKRTDHSLYICLKQVTPLYYENFVRPGETTKREVGKVWFTIEARIATDDNVYENVKDIVLPITLLSATSVVSPLAAAIGWSVGTAVSHHGMVEKSSVFRVGIAGVIDVLKSDKKSLMS